MHEKDNESWNELIRVMISSTKTIANDKKTCHKMSRYKKLLIKKRINKRNA